MSEVFIVSACRTAIGGFLGATKDVPLTTLGAVVVREALRRAGASEQDVDEVILGTVMQGPVDPDSRRWRWLHSRSVWVRARWWLRAAWRA
jgi:acetyl-CoA C-acetyltransferase